MKTIILLFTALTLTSCVESITIRGQYADYTVTPRKPVTIKAEK